MKNKIILTNASWTFSNNIVKNFDAHINQSIPFYLVWQ